MSDIRLLLGDLRARCADLPAESIHSVTTSIPYYGLRSYGTPPQVWGGCQEHAHGFSALGDRPPNRPKRDHAGSHGFGDSRGDEAYRAGTVQPTSQGAVCDHEHEWGEVVQPSGVNVRGNAPGDVSTSGLTNPQRQDTIARTGGGRLCVEAHHEHQWGDELPGDKRGGSGTPTNKNGHGEGYGRDAARGRVCVAPCEHTWGAPTKGSGQRLRNGQGATGLSDHGADGRSPYLDRLPDAETSINSGRVCDHGCGAWLGELGLEPTFEMFIEHVREAFRAIHRVLRRDGTLWLNVGDSYAGSNNGSNDHRKLGKHYPKGELVVNLDKYAGQKPGKQTGLRAKNLMLMPWRVAIALQEDPECMWVLRSDIHWLKCLSGGTRLYARTQKGDMPATIKDLARLAPETVQLWTGQRWSQVVSWEKTATRGTPLEVEFRNGQRVGCTPNHRWPTRRGLVAAEDLRIGDVVETTVLPPPQPAHMPQLLPDDRTGWLVGMFLAEGHLSDKAVILSVNRKEEHIFEMARAIARDLGGTATWRPTAGSGGATIAIHGRMPRAVIQTYIAGDHATNKRLTNAVWQRSNAFLSGLLDAYLDGDGHHDPENSRWRLGFARNDVLASDLRTLAARLGLSLRLKPAWIPAFGGRHAIYRGNLKRRNHRRQPDGEVVGIGYSKGRDFWDVAISDDPHTVALASGILTHNTNPMPESTRSRPTNASEEIFLFVKSDEPTYWLHPTKGGTRKKPKADYVWLDRAADMAETTDEPSDWRTARQHDDNKTHKGGCDCPKRWRRLNQWEGFDYFYDDIAARNPAAAAKTRTTYGIAPKPQENLQDDTKMVKSQKWARETGPRQPGMLGEDGEPMGRNMLNYWLVSSDPCPDAHFACVDDQTEALTPEGWRKHDELIDGQLIAAYGDDGHLNWQMATFHRYPYEGEMVSIEKRDASQLLTPNHRCLVRRRDQDWSVVRADELKPGMEILTGAPFIGDDESHGYPETSADDWAALVGWYIAEGSDEGKAVIIYQSESANPQHVNRIRALLDRLSADYRESRREREWRGRPSVEVQFRVRGAVAAELMARAPGKRMNARLARMPVVAGQALLDALIDGDGNRRADGRACIIQKDRGSIDLMQMLALRLRYRSHIGRHGDHCWALYLTRGTTLTLRETNGRHAPLKRQAYVGTVWCPSVESGFWLARRDGKPFITGNTFPRDVPARTITVGTSEKGACPACGAPWARLVERAKGSSWHDHENDLERGQRSDDNEMKGENFYRHYAVPTVKGWTPTCDCVCAPCEGDGITLNGLTCPTCDGTGVEKPEPCIVLDPFGGSGRTAVAADRLGRDATIIEIKPEYALIAHKTMLKESPMFTRIQCDPPLETIQELADAERK